MAGLTQATLNALTRRWQLDELGLDQEANLARINYRTASQDLLRENKRDKVSLSTNMSDQGLAQSGISVKENLDLQQAMNRASQGMSRQKANTLSTVARKRLQSKADYDNARAMLAVSLAQPPLPPGVV
jgi:hypothetical protein